MTSGSISAAPVDQPPQTLIKLFWALIAIQLLTLFAVTAMSGRYPLGFDEPWYLGTMNDFDRLGPSVQFIRDFKGPPPPLYTIVHKIVEPFFGRQVPMVRVFNAVLALICVVELVVVLKLFEVKQPAVYAAALMGLPNMYLMGGMALTELPAMIFLIPGIAATAKSLMSDKSMGKTIGLAALGGILIGLACTGRQTYLVVLGGVGAAALLRLNKHSVVAFVTCSIFTLLLIGPIFVIWGGLTPPFTREVERALAPLFAFLALSYAGAFMLLLAPRFFVCKLQTAALLVLGGAVVAFTLWPSDFTPLNSVARSVLPESLLPAYRMFFGTMLSTLGMFFLWGCFRAALTRRDEPLIVFCAVATVLICMSALKVSHIFSSRYVAMAFPFMVILAVSYSPLTWNRLARLALGGVLGVMSLHSYYKVHTDHPPTTAPGAPATSAAFVRPAVAPLESRPA